MKKNISLTLIIFTAFITVYGQKVSLERAQGFYEANDLVSAEKEILKTIKSPYSSEEEYAKTMNYYVLIKAGIYGTTESLPSNLNELTDIVKAYSNCKKYDKAEAYQDNLDSKMRAIGDTLKLASEEKLNSNDIDGYLNLMDNYVVVMESVGSEHGSEYSKMADICINSDQNSRALGYWNKMININQFAEEGYTKMLMFFYNQKKYDSVDSLLTLVKSALPQVSSPMAEIEIQRLMEKDLMFRARSVAEKAKANDPSNIEVVFLLGLIKKNLRNLEGAIDAFTEVTSKDPTHFGAHKELGMCFWSDKDEDGNISLAKNYFEKAENLRPDDMEVLDVLKKIYIELGDQDNFSRVLQKIQDQK